jgi:hypothetical protein
MRAALKNNEPFAFHTINYSVSFVNAARPPTQQITLKRFRFSNALERRTLYVPE